MPKTRQHMGRSRKSRPITLSSKLGGRKSAKTAHHQSTANLIEELKSPKRKRDRNKVVSVLRARDVNITEALAASDES